LRAAWSRCYALPMPQTSTPAPRPLVHTVAAFLVAYVVGTLLMAAALAAPAQAAPGGALQGIGEQVAGLGFTVAGTPIPVDLNGDGVLSGDLELGA